MITTITTTVASVASADLRATIVIVPILTLVLLLIQKEVASSLPTPSARQLSQVLDVAIVPLIGVCSIAVILGVRALLQ